jgi:hypothetical protein
MLCPFCLADVQFQRIKQTRSEDDVFFTHLCSNCNEKIPDLYAFDYHLFPPVFFSMVGFGSHGKTTYIASLFYAIKKLSIARDWPDFFTMGLDEDSLDKVYTSARMIDDGNLPDSTPKDSVYPVFSNKDGSFQPGKLENTIRTYSTETRTIPRPIVMRVEGIPDQSNCTLVVYDVGGVCFEKSDQLVKNASFVCRAKAIMLFISVSDLEDPPTGMQRLLSTYLNATRELNMEIGKQHLIVVFSKADQLTPYFTRKWEDLRAYLVEGTVDILAQNDNYMERMNYVSGRLREFTEYELGAHQFADTAVKAFESVEFSLVSALGPQLDKVGLAFDIIPHRILDPLLWVMEKSLSR